MDEQKIDYNNIKEPIDIMTSVTTSFQNTISNLERIIGKLSNSAWEGSAAVSYQNKVKSLFSNLPEANKQLANSALFLASCVNNYLLLDQENIKKLKAIIGDADNDSSQKAKENHPETTNNSTDNQQNNEPSNDKDNKSNSNDNDSHKEKSSSHSGSHHHSNNDSKSSSRSSEKNVSKNNSKSEQKKDNDNTLTTKKEENKTEQNTPSYVLSASEKEARQKVVSTALKELNGHSSSYHTNGKKYLAYFGKSSGLWCSEFTSWVLNAAGVPQDVVKKFSGAGSGAKWFAKQGRLIKKSSNKNYIPQVGDILFTGKGSATHTCIVVKSDGSGKFTTIDGGTSSVHLRNRNIKDSNVYAFGIPDYSKMVDKSKSSVETKA